MVGRARLGAGVSIALLLFALGSLLALKLSDPRCSVSTGSNPLHLGPAPFLVVMVAFGATVLDVVAIRAGGQAARWGRVGILSLVFAVVLGWFALSAATDRLFSC